MDMHLKLQKASEVEEELRQTIAEYEERIANVKSNQELNTGFQLEMGAKLAKASEVETQLRRKIDGHEQQMANLLAKDQAQAQNGLEIQAKLDKANALVQELRLKIDACEQQMAKFAAKEENQAQDQLEMQSKLEKANQLVRELHHKNEGYEKQIADLSCLKVEKPTVPAETTAELKNPAEMPTESGRQGGVTMEQKCLLGSGVSKTVLMAFSICLLAALLAATNVFLFLSGDGLCAPVMPGRVLSGQDDFSSDAPWWAPQGMKVSSFDLLCQGRPRVHLKVEAGKLHLLQEENGKMQTLRKANAATAKITGETIILENKKGSKTLLFAPWAQ